MHKQIAPLAEQVLPGLASATWVLLRGGRTNISWRCDLPTGAVVVTKLFPRGTSNPLFPNDGQAEACLLRHLAGSGLAPDWIGQIDTPVGLCVIYQHIDGPVGTASPRDVGSLMRRLHNHAAPQGLRLAPKGAAGLIAQGQEMLELADDLTVAGSDPLNGQEFPAPPDVADLASAGEVLLHGDIVPANLIGGATGPVLIDWQCPALGDPCEDIAIYLSPAMQVLYGGTIPDSTAQAQFFQGYDMPDVEARYRALAPVFHWRMAAYCLWQARRGKADYAKGLTCELAAFQASLRP